MSLRRSVVLLSSLIGHFAQPVMRDAPLEIEGTSYEGGGGLVRETLTYAAILGQPVRIHRIRAGRPGRGGLRVEHTTAVATMAQLCGAEVVGNEEASQELTFAPQARAPSVPADGVLDRTIEGAASIFAIAMLPYVLFANLAHPLPRVRPGALLPPDGLTLRIRAGTLCIKAPSLGWMRQVLVPWLRHIGISEEHFAVDAAYLQGFHTDFLKVPGLMTVRVTPLRSALPAFQLEGRGTVVGVHATVHAPPDRMAAAERQVAADLATYFGEGIATSVGVEATTHPGQYHLLLTATTARPWAVLGYEQIFPAREGFPDGIADDVPRLLRHLSRLCIRGLQDELRHGKAVDEHMENILVPYQVFAQGFSTVEGQDGHVRRRAEREQQRFVYPPDEYHYDASTLHQATSLFIANRITGVEFSNPGNGFGCHGLGLGANATM